MAASCDGDAAVSVSSSDASNSRTRSTVPTSDATLPLVAVVLVIGLPAAGKTTFIRQLASSPSLVLHHVCIDELYNQQVQSATLQSTSQPTFSPALWHAAREAAYSRAVELLQTLSSIAPHDSPVCNVVCVDDVFHLRSMRQSYYRLCRSHQVPFHQLHIHTPRATCLNNLAARSTTTAIQRTGYSAAHSQLTAEYVTAVSDRFDRPNEAEMRYTTVVQMGDRSSSELDWSFLFCPFVPPPLAAHTADEPTAAHVQSAVHELDIALRRAIGQRMAEWTARQQHTSTGDTKGRDSAAAVNYARHVNDLRKRMLVDARQSGTVVYETMQAASDAGNNAEANEESRVQAEVQRAVAYFNSLTEDITIASAAQQTTGAA